MQAERGAVEVVAQIAKLVVTASVHGSELVTRAADLLAPTLGLTPADARLALTAELTGDPPSVPGLDDPLGLLPNVADLLRRDCSLAAPGSRTPCHAGTCPADLDDIPDYVTRCDLAGRLTWVNRAVVLASGVPREAFVGQDLAALGAASLSEAFAEVRRRCLDTGEEQWIEFEWPTPVGPAVCEGRVVAERDGSGRIVSLLTTARDVTERKKALSAQGMLAAIVESTPDAIIGATLDGRITSWNAAATRLFGFTEAEAIGETIFLLTPDDFRDEVGRRLEHHRNGGVSAEWEGVCKRRDGRLIEAAISSTPVRDRAGRVIGLAALVRDITQRKATERNLTFKRRLLAERVRELRCAHEVSLRLTSPIEDDAELLAGLPEIIASGWQMAEATGVRLTIDGRRWETPGFRESDWSLTAAIGPREEPFGILEVVHLADGLPELREPGQVGPFLPEERALVIDLAARIGETLLRRRAQRALARREAFWRLIIHGLKDVVTVLRHDGTVLYESPSIEGVAGYLPSELEGRNILDIIHPDDRERVTAAVAQGVSEVVEYRYLHKDGRWMDGEAQGKSFIDDEDMSGLIVVSRDVTERKAADAQRAKLEAQLRQSQKMEAIGRLAGGIAHDFNNLLTIIQSATAMLLEQLPEGGPMHVDAQEIAQAAERAAALTSQLLTFSKRGVVRVVPVELRDALRDAERMLRRIIGEDVQLKTRAASGVGRVEVDPGQLHQIILNLAVNAREAMPTGGELVLALRPSAELPHGFSAPGPAPLGYSVIEVKDTGEGIAPEHLDHVFEPFFTTKEHGTGLGLATVYGIVQQAGGVVAIDSALGRGTTVSVFLPRIPDAPPAKLPHGARTTLSGTETILLVEDEDHLRRLARRVLERAGYVVLDAPNGAAALERSAAYPGRIHLLLTDVVMPGLSGPDLAEQLAPLRPTTRVLFTSGYADTAVAGRKVHDGVTAFLPKPFTPDTLTQKVREVLDAPAAREG